MTYTKITDRKIRFALIGCGRISKNHFDSIAQHSAQAVLVDVCDINPEALAVAVKSTGANGHASISQLLEKTKADCIILTTPSGLHPSQTIMSAIAGKHVLSEKPMATKWEDGVRMVDSKRFGQIYMVNMNVFWQRPQHGYYDLARWRGTWDLDGGAFMNQASHYVDLLEWVIGPIDSLHAYTATLARDIEAEDTGVLSVKWRNGALGSLNCTMLTYPKNLEGSITILGEKGTVRIGGVAVNEIQEWQFADKQPDDEQIKQASYATTSVYGFGHPLYYENVIKVLRGQASPDVDGREGLKSLEVLIAAYRSSRDGVRVGLPLEL